MGDPVALAHLSMNPRVGIRSPASARAIAGWVVPMTFASSICVLPERRLAFAKMSPISVFVKTPLYLIGYIVAESQCYKSTR